MEILKTEAITNVLNLEESRPHHSEAQKIGRDCILLFIIMSLILILPVTAFAQGWYWGSSVTPGYDRKSVVELNGIVLQIDSSLQRSISSLRFESGDEVLTVMLAPGWYLKEHNMSIHIGDKLTITGSTMKSRGG
jgi:hypothetical protein